MLSNVLSAFTTVLRGESKRRVGGRRKTVIQDRGACVVIATKKVCCDKNELLDCISEEERECCVHFRRQFLKLDKQCHFV